MAANDATARAAMLELQRWDAADDATRERAARLVTEAMPAFGFLSLEHHTMGSASHVVATFDHAAGRFALLPGARADLGYDRDRPPPLTAGQRAEWANTMEDEVGVSVEEYLDEVTSPSRRVVLGPMLMEVAARETDRTVQGTIAPITHSQALAAAAGEGLRLPGGDEWEYACRAGTTTLFRWGDDCPTDAYPVGDETPFDLHRQLNAFGLAMPASPYDYEFVSERNQMRGGDGGSNVCGGAGYVAGWLPLASAFVETNVNPDEPAYNAWLRRAASVVL